MDAIFRILFDNGLKLYHKCLPGSFLKTAAQVIWRIAMNSHHWNTLYLVKPIRSIYMETKPETMDSHHLSFLNGE